MKARLRFGVAVLVLTGLLGGVTALVVVSRPGTLRRGSGCPEQLTLSKGAGSVPASGPEQLWQLVEAGTELEARRAGTTLARLAQENRGERLNAPGMSLAPRLGHASPRVRTVAVQVVREAELQYFIPHLVCRLSDVNWRVRFAAAATLEELTGQAFGAFDKNTPLEVRDRAILSWQEYWIARDPGDGLAELLALYANDAHLELGPELSELVLGPLAAGGEEDFPLAVEVRVTLSETGDRLLTLVVRARPGVPVPSGLEGPVPSQVEGPVASEVEGPAPAEPEGLNLEVRILDEGGHALVEASLPCEVTSAQAEEEAYGRGTASLILPGGPVHKKPLSGWPCLPSRQAKLGFALPAAAVAVEYQVVARSAEEAAATPAKRLAAGRVRLEDVSFLPFAQ